MGFKSLQEAVAMHLRPCVHTSWYLVVEDVASQSLELRDPTVHLISKVWDALWFMGGFYFVHSGMRIWLSRTLWCAILLYYHICLAYCACPFKCRRK